MVSDMDTGNMNNGEEVHSSSTNSSTIPVSIVNCSSARQSPKIPTPIVTSPSSIIHHRNSASPSMPRKIMSKNTNNTS